VQRICGRADISERTFFNYFSSKDDAILGGADLTFTADGVVAFLAGEGTDIVLDLARLFAHGMDAHGAHPELADQRRALLLSSRRLMALRFESLVDQWEHWEALVTQRSGLDRDEASAIVVGALSAVHLAMITAHRSGTDVAASVAASLEALRSAGRE
jgi:AcrR family transcriptional regulator